jgi:hypothetical protein
MIACDCCIRGDAMSFDLAVWFEEASRLTLRSALEKYERLCDGDDADIVPSERVAAFHRAVTAVYPEITSTRDVDLDACPWQSAMDLSPGHVIMAITWSRADEVGSVVRALASEHGLVCFDPQAGVVHAPRAGSSRRLLWQCCDGTALIRMDVESVVHELDRLSTRNWFAILDESDDRYVQVGCGRRADVPDGQFAVEYRDGSPERHFRHETASLDIVKDVFRGFAADSCGWFDRLTWERTPF